MKATRRTVGRKAAMAIAAAAAAGTFAAVMAPGAMADVNPLIVGGSPTTIEEHPATVIFNVGGSQHCAGTLVAANKVVTAAHCTDGVEAGEMEIISGQTNFSDTDGEKAGVSDFWQHPDFDMSSMTHDVSVLTLDTELSAEPAKLVESADDDAYADDTDVTIVGWGATSSGGPVSDELLEVTVPVANVDECASAYDGAGMPFDTASMFCAGIPDGGKDACQGDSGGPAYVDGRLAGIVSWGKGCAEAGFPGVYTNVGNDYAKISEQVGS